MILSRPTIFRAGMIPYFYDGQEIKMLFMKPSDTTYLKPEDMLFQIAKGKVESDETEMECAIREAIEETGIRTSNIISVERLGEDYYLGRTALFVCKLWTDDEKEFDKPSEETYATTWMTFEEFKRRGRELHIPLVEDAYERICLIEQIN